MGLGNGPLDVPGEPPRQGIQRRSQAGNTLLQKPELGKVKKCTVSLPPQDYAFGLSRPRDPEGAREVTFMWVQHQTNPDDKPGPDFKAMNRLAAVSEITSAKEQRGFRSTNPRVLKQGLTNSKLNVKPELPSDHNVDWTYGRQSSNVTVEVSRVAGGGPQPHIKNIVQGSFQYDWIQKNLERRESLLQSHQRMAPVATKASEGHALGAKMAFDPPHKAPWKMSKFGKKGCKVNSFNGTKAEPTPA